MHDVPVRRLSGQLRNLRLRRLHVPDLQPFRMLVRQLRRRAVHLVRLRRLHLRHLQARRLVLAALLDRR
ncbi:hypothetical protein [Demetria terragena]|uniref:hypothetical protein n=1 Tax=Demetria terragena TaxID=63959 RepID=UPI0003667D9E|nr:hypothetical protein [Demetria terragena]